MPDLVVLSSLISTNQEKMYLVDLPGYGFAQVPIEDQGPLEEPHRFVLSATEHPRNGSGFLDSRRGWMEPDLELKQWLEFQRIPYIVVATKIDKLIVVKKQTDSGRSRSNARTVYWFLSRPVTGRGVREIWQAISKTKMLRQ